MTVIKKSSHCISHREMILKIRINAHIWCANIVSRHTHTHTQTLKPKLHCFQLVKLFVHALLYLRLSFSTSSYNEKWVRCHFLNKRNHSKHCEPDSTVCVCVCACVCVYTIKLCGNVSSVWIHHFFITSFHSFIRRKWVETNLERMRECTPRQNVQKPTEWIDSATVNNNLFVLCIFMNFIARIVFCIVPIPIPMKAHAKSKRYNNYIVWIILDNDSK